MPRFRFDDPWRTLWRIATSNNLLAALLLALALALLLTAWLPQTSKGALDLDLAWQAEAQQRFGGSAWFDTLRGPLQTLGVFHVTDAVWYRLLLALLAFALLARLVDSAERVWQRWRGRAAVKEAHGNGREQGAVTAEAEAPRVEGRPWGELGSVAAYGGGLLILVGAAITSTLGWQMGPLPMPPGASVPLGHDTQLAFRLESLAPDGQRGFGQLWRAEDTLVSSGELALGQPLEGEGVGIYLVGSGDALQVHATNGDGQPLELVTGPQATAQEDPILMFTQEEPRHLVAAPEVGLVLLLTMSEEDKGDPRPQVQVFDEDSGELLPGQDALDNTTLTVRDASFVLTPVRYAEVRAVYDRGAIWIQLGVIGLVAGAALWGWRSGRRRSETSPSRETFPSKAVGQMAQKTNCTLGQRSDEGRA